MGSGNGAEAFSASDEDEEAVALATALVMARRRRGITDDGKTGPSEPFAVAPGHLRTTKPRPA